MNLPDLGEIDDFLPVPEIFHSLNGPFDKCLICNRDILDDSSQYMIDRVFVGEEPIMECAMCFACQIGISKELSEISRQRIAAHMEERTDLLERRQSLLRDYGRQVHYWIDECILTGKKRSDCRSYAIYGHCQGTDLIFSYLPYMVSDDGFQQIQQLVSKPTRDRLEDLNDEYFGMPPELTDIPFSFV